MAVALAVGALGPAIKVLKLVTKPILRQFNYLCCFTSNINSLKDEAKNLDDALSGLEGEIEKARDNVQEPVAEVKTWLTKSKNIKDEINQIVSEAPKVESGCLKIGARFSLSKKAKKTTDRTKVLRGEKKFDVKFQQGPPAARREAQLRKTYEFESRKEIEESIMTTLRGGDVNMIGIHGMGGLGKTTMARKLMNRALEENLCQEVVIATVSENVDISKIQDEIGGQLGLKTLKDEKSESARATILHDRLSGTKRILLVLDDVWKTLELEDFGIPRDSKGCTILFTSRNRDALRDAQIFGMTALSEEEAWPFFKERAGTCVDDRELNPIAKQVAKECGGLPINLAAVAAGLRDKRNAAIWKDTLRDLKQRVPDNVKFDNKTYNSLKRSYDLLESEISKSIFLLCCLFPEDANIRVEYLTYFCMGLDMFEGITNMEDARNKMWVETEFLKDRSLLLESDEKDCVRMHDVVRDVCTFIAKEKEYIGKDGCTWISSSHLVGQRNALLSGSRCPNLHLLFLNSRYDDSSRFKLDDAFLQGMRELCVLCVENYHSLTTLPHPTQSLGNLTTLILDSCDELETISAVGELVNLEILICRDCYWIRELPSEMKRLKSLKVLELTGCRWLQSIERGIISSLVGLEELKMSRSFSWEAEDREGTQNASIKELEALPNLACLEIDIYDFSLLTENMPLISSKKIVSFKIRTDGGNIPSEFSKAMRLYLERESCLGDWIEMQFLRDTEYLDLSGDGSNNVDLAKSQNIKSLNLWSCKSMKNVVRTSGGSGDATVFPSIENLYLNLLPELQEICDGSILSCSFQDLKELRLANLPALTQFWKSSSVPQSNYVPHFSNLSCIVIDECPGLRNLEELSMAGKDCLLQLQELRIGKCEMMEQVFLWNNTTSIELRRKHHVIFPKLKEVKLDSLPNLTTFYQGIQSIEFPLLMEMKIEKCPKMKSILGSSADIDEDGSLHLFCQPQKVSFGSLEELMIDHVGSKSIFTLSVAANLRSLRELRIRNCDEMIKVIEHEQQVASGGKRILVFPKLEFLQLEKLPKLVTLSDSKCEVELPSLRKVEIERCPNMKNFILSKAGKDCLPQLEHLSIKNCEMMEQVFLWNDGEEAAGKNKTSIESQQKRHVIFPKLKEVELVSLPNLTTFYQGIQGIEFPLLMEMKIEKCPNWKNIIIESSGAGIDEDDSLLVLNKKVSFGSLEVLMIDDVGSMSIFTHSMAANLRELSIRNCDEMIKVIEDEQQQERILVFPKLEIVKFEYLPKLVSFCDWKCEVELPSLRKVEIERCPNMENFSMGLVATPNLETFKTDISTYVGVGVDDGFRNLKKLKISRSENPLYDDKISLSICNGLEKLTFILYKGSKSLFSSSAVENLVNLKELCIGSCDEIVKVIEDEEEEDDVKVVSGGATRTIVFPKLEELYLRELPKLERFCEWKCDVELPSLTKVVIRSCPNMECISIGFVAAPDLKSVKINLRDIGATEDLNGLLLVNSYFARQEGVSLDSSLRVLKISHNAVYGHKIPPSICNGLEELTINEYEGSMSICTLSVAANLVNLRKLRIKNCDEMKKVIEDKEQQQRILLFPKLQFLELKSLPKLVSFCDWKCEVELPLLRRVQIERCPNMENFSMGFVATPYLESFKTDLNTYVGVGLDVAFSSLKKLKISRSENPLHDDKISLSIFNGLEKLTFVLYKGSMSLFSSSAVGNLGNLKELRIGFCDKILRVIEDEEEEDDVKVVSGGAIRTVVFPKLEELTLKELPKLVSFCGWKCDLELPSLTNLWIMDCRNVESFSMGYVAAPNLKIVEIDEEEIDAIKDLNGALQQHYLARQEKEHEEEKEESSEEEDDQN